MSSIYFALVLFVAPAFGQQTLAEMQFENTQAREARALAATEIQRMEESGQTVPPNVREQFARLDAEIAKSDAAIQAMAVGNPAQPPPQAPPAVQDASFRPPSPPPGPRPQVMRRTPCDTTSWGHAALGVFPEGCWAQNDWAAIEISVGTGMDAFLVEFDGKVVDTHPNRESSRRLPANVVPLSMAAMFPDRKIPLIAAGDTIFTHLPKEDGSYTIHKYHWDSGRGVWKYVTSCTGEYRNLDARTMAQDWDLTGQSHCF